MRSMWKKLALFFVTLLGVLTIPVISTIGVNTNMDAATSIMKLKVRDNTGESTFTMGSHIFQAVKESNGELFAFVQGGVERVPVCSSAGLTQPAGYSIPLCINVSYANTNLPTFEAMMNANISQNEDYIMNGQYFIPTRGDLDALTPAQRVDSTINYLGQSKNNYNYNGVFATYNFAGDFVIMKQSNYTQNGGSFVYEAGSGNYYPLTTHLHDTTQNNTFPAFSYMVRPAVKINMNNVVFSVNADGRQKVNFNELVKLRRLDNNLTISVQSKTIEWIKDSSFDVEFQKGPDGTASSLLCNAANVPLYYNVHGTSSGTATISTADLTPGNTYYLYFVTEEITSDNRPSRSSALSAPITVKIVDQHKLAYAKQPESGASAGKDYEYTKNVDGGSKVGVITVNPKGVMPLTYTIETSGGDNTYQNFE
ncbi:MAG: hypothetical protein HFE68_07465, partial [Erysipelotrichaceae bacterium]|nr:hypothetical protein [Erysipelotrichaceae bacterium]